MKTMMKMRMTTTMNKFKQRVNMKVTWKLIYKIKHFYINKFKLVDILKVNIQILMLSNYKF